MADFRGNVLAFVMGFGCCAGIARLMLPTTVGAHSSMTAANPAEVASIAGEAVVNLEVLPDGPEPSRLGALPRLLGMPAAPDPEPTSVASGVIVSDKGFIVTNDHVVAEAGRIRARLADGREFTARVVGRDPHTDLAVLKIPGRGLKSARLGESREIRAGESVVAIGNPLGFENSVSVGVVSANRQGPFRIDGRTLGDMLQTDAPINQGNSGGGLFGADGRLVGVNTAIMVPRGGSGSIGIGFAIPAHRIKPVLDNLVKHGRVPRPWLGITYHRPRTGIFVGRETRGPGVLVEEVLPGSPAAEAGVRPADILRQIGDTPIRSADDLYDFAGRYHPGEKVRAQVLRGGKPRALMLTLGERPAS